MVIQKQTAAEKKPLTPAMEDYMEAIFELDKEKRVVRVKDIANRMNVKMPTVSSMLRTLNSRGLVNYEKYEYVEMTRKGSRVGKEMRRRHGILQTFLSEILRVDAATASEEACRMEHALSSETLDRFTDFMAFIQSCPRTGENWLEHFDEYRKDGCPPDKCKARSERFVSDFKAQVSARFKEEP